MNRTLILAALSAAAILAACGGGGSSSGPIPNPAQSTAPVAYTSYLRFVGALAGAQVQSDLRRAQSVSPMSAATPIPIMVISPVSTGNSGVFASANAVGFGGTVQAIVSPEPSSSPSVAFTTTNIDSQFQPTPTPSGSPAPMPSGVIAEQNVSSNPSTLNAQSSGTATAAIGAPVNSSPQTQVYTYRAIDLECASPIDPGTGPAFAWNGSAWTAVSDPSQADIYMDGPYCDSGLFLNPSESETTVHYPGGGIAISDDAVFSSVASSQWQNSNTGESLLTLITQNPDGSCNCLILFKTASGATVKIFPDSIGRGGRPDFGGAIEVSGSSVDGF